MLSASWPQTNYNLIEFLPRQHKLMYCWRRIWSHLKQENLIDDYMTDWYFHLQWHSIFHQQLHLKELKNKMVKITATVRINSHILIAQRQKKTKKLSSLRLFVEITVLH